MTKYAIQVPVSVWVEVVVETDDQTEGERDALDKAHDEVLASPLADHLTMNTQDWEIDPLRSAQIQELTADAIEGGA